MYKNTVYAFKTAYDTKEKKKFIENKRMEGIL